MKGGGDRKIRRDKYTEIERQGGWERAEGRQRESEARRHRDGEMEKPGEKPACALGEKEAHGVETHEFFSRAGSMLGRMSPQSPSFPCSNSKPHFTHQNSKD